VDGELEGEDLAAIETLAESDPELQAQRREAGEIRKLLRSRFDPEIDPPNTDFFNARILQGIRDIEAHEKVAAGSSQNWWRSPWLVAAAAVVVAVFVMLDRPAGEGDEPNYTSLTNTYTPHARVVLKTYHSEAAGATVIELEGFEVPTDREITGQSVASYEPGEPGSALTLYSADDARQPLIVMLKDTYNNPIVYEIGD
jgi:anti-sigma-K factor RskA